MQRATRRVAPTMARTALCAVLPWAWWGCSPDLAIGDASDREQALDQAPSAQPTASASPLTEDSAAPQPLDDFSVAPQLAAPEVTMRIDSGGIAQVAISGAGDLDGDGFGDFAIEGKERTNGVNFVHIRYGGPRSTEHGSGFALEQSGARLLLGPFLHGAIEVIQPAGDVDGDGFGDLLIGLTRCHPAQASEGAYLLYGGPERLSGVLPLDEAAVQLRDPREPAPSAESSCGIELDPHLAALGDFDGDGFDDFVIADQHASGESTAYLFYGSAQRIASGASLLAADARFQLEGDLIPTATGDVNADGTGDLLLSVLAPVEANPRSLFLPGGPVRREGDVDLASAGTDLGTLFPFTGSGTTFPRPALNSAVLGPPDVDGDGTADLLLWSHEGSHHLFYGQSGLFADGVDRSQSVVLDNDAGQQADLWFAGDRDGDGDVELVARFYPEPRVVQSDVAFVGGSRQRASGSLSFPVQATLQANPGGALREHNRFLECITSAGDLDGDGADDLLTTSTYYEVEGDEADGFSFSGSDPELHIHYGVPGGAAAPPVR